MHKIQHLAFYMKLIEEKTGEETNIIYDSGKGVLYLSASSIYLEKEKGRFYEIRNKELSNMVIDKETKRLEFIYKLNSKINVTKFKNKNLL